jgi:hypothetical protein
MSSNAILKEDKKIASSINDSTQAWRDNVLTLNTHVPERISAY